MGQLFEQCCLGTFPLRMCNKFLSGYFRSVVSPVSHLVACWWQHFPKLPGNIAQKVAPCIISLTLDNNYDINVQTQGKTFDAGYCWWLGHANIF